MQPRTDPIFVKMFNLEVTTPALFMQIFKNYDSSVLKRIQRKLIIFVHNDLSNNKLMISAMEDITLKDETPEDYAIVLALQNVMSHIDSRSSNVSIDATEDWDNYGKIQILRKSETFYTVALAHCNSRFIDFFNIELAVNDAKVSNYYWDVKRTKLQTLSQTLLGINKFSFNDYYANILGNSIEVVIVQDSNIFFVRLCTLNGSILEFFNVSDLEHLSRLTNIECYYQENDGNRVDVMHMTSECVVATQGSYIYSFTVTRELIWREVLEFGSATSLRKYYRIKSAVPQMAYTYPCTNKVSELILGEGFFLTYTKSSNYALVYERGTNNPYTIGAIQKPYMDKAKFNFLRVGEKEHLTITNGRENGSVFRLGEFKLKFRNPISRRVLRNHCQLIEKYRLNPQPGRSLDEELSSNCDDSALALWLTFNEKMENHGFAKKQFRLKILPRALQAEEAEEEEPKLSNKAWLTAILLVILGLAVISCIAVKREKRTRHKLRGELRSINRQLRAQVMDLKYRQIHPDSQAGHTDLGTENFGQDLQDYTTVAYQY